MLKKSLLYLALSSTFCALLLAQTQSNVQIDKPISGKEAKEVLQNFPKEVKSTIKISRDKTKVAKSAKGGNIYPWSSLVFNENTESYLTLKDSANNPILLVLYTKDSPGITKGSGLAINNNALKMNYKNENSDRRDKMECLPQYRKYSVRKWDKKTGDFKDYVICPYDYYNGGHNFNAEYSEWGMPYTNSFGMWIKLNRGYFSNDFTLFSRNEKPNFPMERPSGWVYDYFRVELLFSGRISVTSKMSSNYSSQNIATTKPIPIGKWVYIQAIQNGRNYQLGWKAQDGSDEELVSKELSADTIKMLDDEDVNLSVQRNRVFKVFDEYEVNRRSLDINIKEVFYEPTAKMYELMNNYNVREKLIFSSGGFEFIPITTLAIEVYKVLIGEGSSIISNEDFDIYYDDTTGNILAVDFRIK